jgi:hypothetical protein
MTLRAYLITLRGRIREALCPDLQVLRNKNRYHCAEVEGLRHVVSKWKALYQAQVQLLEAAQGRAEAEAEVERLREALEAALDRIPHECEGLDYAEADCPACQVKALAKEPTK